MALLRLERTADLFRKPVENDSSDIRRAVGSQIMITVHKIIYKMKKRFRKISNEIFVSIQRYTIQKCNRFMSA